MFYSYYKRISRNLRNVYIEWLLTMILEYCCKCSWKVLNAFHKAIIFPIFFSCLIPLTLELFEVQISRLIDGCNSVVQCRTPFFGILLLPDEPSETDQCRDMVKGHHLNSYINNSIFIMPNSLMNTPNFFLRPSPPNNAHWFHF